MKRFAVSVSYIYIKREQYHSYTINNTYLSSKLEIAFGNSRDEVYGRYHRIETQNLPDKNIAILVTEIPDVVPTNVVGPEVINNCLG